MRKEYLQMNNIIDLWKIKEIQNLKYLIKEAENFKLWDVGEIIELEQMVNEPLEILINGVKIGEGEAVIVEGKFGLKIKKIINEDLKLDKIGL
jgi:hypothetical protein